MEKSDIIGFYLDNDILLSPDIADDLVELTIPLKSEFSVVSRDVLMIMRRHIPVNIDDFEKSVVLNEKYKNSRMYQKFLEYIIKTDERLSRETEQPKHELPIAAGSSTITHHTIQPIVQPQPQKQEETREEQPPEHVDSEHAPSRQHLSEQEIEDERKKLLAEHKVKLVMDYNEKNRKRTVNDFIGYFNSRYKDLERVLRQRQELQNLTSISRINAKKERDNNVAIAGFVYDKQVTKKGNIMLTLEDPTGFIKVVVRQNKEELFSLANEIQLDEIIGVTGTYDQLIFANNILLPDIPLTKELKKSPEEGYFIVLGDFQVGNKLFLEKEFLKLISWLNQGVGSEAQKDIASKVKYIFIVGDLVEGVGIYPDQEYDLTILDAKAQYDKFAEYMRMIPPQMLIFVCPGNHDVGRMAEPQPRFHDEYSRALWMIPNVIPVSNPSVINIYAQPESNFDGFDVLLYHGYSFFYYFSNVPSIRSGGGPKRSDLVMKYLLQRRHLAPAHTSTLYIPDPKKDPLTIEKVPDFFFSGHVHRASVNNYKNVTCINASCWVSKSEEQERRGLEPQPARAFIVNMQTREIKIMNFLSKEDQAKEAGESHEPLEGA